MKLFFMICAFWVTPFIEGIPSDYIQWLQPRGISDIPVLNWWFGSNDSSANDTEKTNVQETTSMKENYEENQSSLEDVDNQTTSKTKRQEIPYISGEKNTHEDQTSQDQMVKVQPVEGVLPGEQAEPIEDFLKKLEKEIEESNDEDKKNYANILVDLENTMEKSPKPLARVFIDKAWRLVDIGFLNSSRRIRGVEDSSALTNLLSYLLPGWITRIFQFIPFMSSQTNTSPGIATFNSMFPSVTSNYFGNPAQHNLLGGAIGLPKMNGDNLGLGGNKSLNDLITVICLTGDKNGENDLFAGKTKEDILNKIHLRIDKGDTDSEQKWLIILKLFKMFNDPELDEKTKKKLHDIIVIISRRPDFDTVFKAIEKKNEENDDPRYKEIQNLFTKAADRHKEVYVIVPPSGEHEHDPNNRKKSEHNDLYVTVVPPSKAKASYEYDAADQKADNGSSSQYENKSEPLQIKKEHEYDPDKSISKVTIIEKHIGMGEDDPSHTGKKVHFSPLQSNSEPSKHIIHQTPTPTHENHDFFTVYYPYTDPTIMQKIIKDPTKGYVSEYGEPLYTILLSIRERLQNKNLSEDWFLYIIDDLKKMDHPAEQREDTNKLYDEILQETAAEYPTNPELHQKIKEYHENDTTQSTLHQTIKEHSESDPTQSKLHQTIKGHPENDEHIHTDRYELPPTVDENGMTSRGYIVRTTTTRSSSGGYPLTTGLMLEDFSLLRPSKIQPHGMSLNPQDQSLHLSSNSYSSKINRIYPHNLSLLDKTDLLQRYFFLTYKKYPLNRDEEDELEFLKQKMDKHNPDLQVFENELLSKNYVNKVDTANLLEDFSNYLTATGNANPGNLQQETATIKDFLASKP